MSYSLATYYVVVTICIGDFDQFPDLDQREENRVVLMIWAAGNLQFQIITNSGCAHPMFRSPESTADRINSRCIRYAVNPAPLNIELIISNAFMIVTVKE